MSSIKTTHIPSQPDIHEAQHILEALAPDGAEVKVQLREQQFTLPDGLTSMLREILINAASGKVMTIIPMNADLTSQQVAEYLHVSRQFFVNEANAGRIKYRKVGTHRRFAFTDVIYYERSTERESLAARQALADQAQELGLDD